MRSSEFCCRITAALGQGLALIAWGTLIIGLVDNLLRPILVGRDTRIPGYVVMIATSGSLAVFGVNGFVLGPVIAVMFLAVWHIQFVSAAATAQVHGRGKRCSSQSPARCRLNPWYGRLSGRHLGRR